MYRLIASLVVLVLTSTLADSATYYLSPSGSDGSPCTQSQPCQTLDKGVSLLGAGDTLRLAGGTYEGSIGFPSQQGLPSGGTSWDTAIRVESLPGETANFTRGIAISDGSGYWIFDRLSIRSFFMGCGAHHVRFQNGEVSDTPDNLVAGCGDGMELVRSKVHNAQVQWFPQCNNFTGCYAASYGFYWQGRNSLIEGNEIYNNTGYGIHMFSSGSSSVSNNIVRGNTFWGNGFDDAQRGNMAWGLLLSCGSNNHAYNNVLYGNAAGIQVAYRCTNCLVYHNTIYDNGSNGMGGITISNDAGSGVRVQNNIVFNNGRTISDDGPGTFVSNNLTEDPGFVNAGAHDFHLQPGSAAMDKATCLSEVPTDIAGVSRPQGSGCDIGAYEGGGENAPATPAAAPSPTPPTRPVVRNLRAVPQ